MNIETVYGSRVYSDIMAEPTIEGTHWNMLIREGGSLSLYLTGPGIPGHGVVFDSADNQVPSETAVRVLNEWRKLHDLKPFKL